MLKEPALLKNKTRCSCTPVCMKVEKVKMFYNLKNSSA